MVLDLLQLHALGCAMGLGGKSVEGFVQDYIGTALPCVRFVVDPDIELLFVASSGYPGIPPVLLVTTSDTHTEQVPLDWDLSVDPDRRLIVAVRRRFHGAPPYSVVYGPSPQMLVTASATKARDAGWQKYFSGGPQQAEDIRKSLFSRSSGLLSDSLSSRSVLIVGLGSGGSYVAECLVRAGVGRVVLIDGDTVESHNLSRTTYYIDDVGVPKVTAMTRHLLNINPLVEVVPHAVLLKDLGHASLAETVKSVDLIVALTDDPHAQSRLNHYAYYHNRPAIFAALYRGAQGGEVIVCVPGQTPCLECATGGVRAALSRPDSDVDYGTGRLSGEPAINADIHHLDSATVKLSLSLLLRGMSDLSVSHFIASALQRRFSYLCMSMVPNYWVFPHVFGDTPGQHGYQAMWFTVESRDSCPFCGPPENREDPASFPLAPPSNVMRRSGT
jgi:hypothetical protein